MLTRTPLRHAKTSAAATALAPRSLEEPFQGHAQRIGEVLKLEIRDASDLGFNLREGFAADVPAEEIQFRNQLLLRESSLLAKLSNHWTDDVLRRPHVPKTELDHAA